MADFTTSEVLIGVFASIFLFNHLVLKHFLLRRLREQHLDIWRQMGGPTVFSMKESHWTLIGFISEFNLCESLGNDETSQETRAQVYRYRVFSAIEVIAVVAMMVAIFAGL